MDTYDVAVIGAGLSGLWCARALAWRGLSVAIVDAHPVVDRVVRTTGIFVRRTFDDFDLPPRTLGPPIRSVVLYSPRRRAIAFESEHDEFRIGDMRALYRALLDDCLRAGATWLPATRYRDLQAAGATSVLQLRDVKSRATMRIAARFVVGADGARSRVASDLGLSANRDFLVGLEDVYDDVAVTSPPALHCFLEPRLAPGYIAWIARDGRDAHVGLAGDARRCRPAPSLRAFTRSVRDTLGAPFVRRRDRRGGLIPWNGVLPRIACPRGLLVGDAAGAVSPLTAGGLDGCIRLAEFAARIIPEQLRAPDSGVIASYDGRRFAARFIARRWMREFLRNSGVRALELACAALTVPAVRAIGAHTFFGRGSFPDTGSRRVPRGTRVAHRPVG
jgi:flavin-dependent dehydrogenase